MLTKEQIARLYKFCVQHYVRYYDVQIELVDHLANAIEAKMEADKKLDFETALSSVYAGFGVMGFSKIITEKTEAASRQIWKNNRKYFREYFTIPKIAFTILLFCIFAFLYFQADAHTIKIFIATIFVCFMLLAVVQAVITFRARKKPKKELLCLHDVSVFQSFGLVAQLPVFLNFFLGRSNRDLFNAIVSSPVYYFLFASIFIALLLLSFASLKTYKAIQQSARKNYPLAFE